MRQPVQALTLETLRYRNQARRGLQRSPGTCPHAHTPAYVCVPGVQTHRESHTCVWVHSAMLRNSDDAHLSLPMTSHHHVETERRESSPRIGKETHHPEQADFHVHVPQGPGCSHVWENVPFPPGWPLIAFDGFLPERWVLLPGRSLSRSGIDVHQILLLHSSRGFKTVANMCDLFKQHWGN